MTQWMYDVWFGAMILLTVYAFFPELFALHKAAMCHWFPSVFTATCV